MESSYPSQENQNIIQNNQIMWVEECVERLNQVEKCTFHELVNKRIYFDELNLELCFNLAKHLYDRKRWTARSIPFIIC